MTPSKLSATDLDAYTGNWILDAARTTVDFRTKAMWIMPVKGSARAIGGSGKVGSDGAVEGRLIIDTASIQTGVTKRDQHLKTADFFDAERNPTIEFDLTGVRSAESGRLAMDGQLLVHGERRAVTLDAAVTVVGDTATVTGIIDDLDRRPWGLTWAKMGAGVHTKVTVTAVFTRVRS
jgi:polyisoprenoid-binding protein YceI